MYSKLRILSKILCPYFSLSMFIKLVNFFGEIVGSLRLFWFFKKVEVKKF